MKKSLSTAIDHVSGPEIFVFDIHGVLVGVSTQERFMRYLTRKMQVDSRLKMGWKGDVPALMNGLLYRYCPLCNFKPCEKSAINATPHVKRAVFRGELSYQEMKVLITQMLTHYVECNAPSRIILEYLTEFMTRPAFFATGAEVIDEGVALLRYVYKKYGPESVFLLSNTSSQLYDIYCKQFPSVFGCVPREHVILSAEVGVCKPDRHIYELFLERYNVFPEKCVVIDDGGRNVLAARKVQMQALLFEVGITKEKAVFYKQIAFSYNADASYSFTPARQLQEE